MATVTPTVTLIGRHIVKYDEDTDEFTYQGEAQYTKCGDVVVAPYVVTKASSLAVTEGLSNWLATAFTYDDVTDCP